VGKKQRVNEERRKRYSLCRHQEQEWVSGGKNKPLKKKMEDVHFLVRKNPTTMIQACGDMWAKQRNTHDLGDQNRLRKTEPGRIQKDSA